MPNLIGATPVNEPLSWAVAIIGMLLLLDAAVSALKYGKRR